MAAMSGAWLCKKVRHPWLGGPRRLTMYLATLDCATSNPSLSSSPWMRGAPQSGFSLLIVESVRAAPSRFVAYLPVDAISNASNSESRPWYVLDAKSEIPTCRHGYEMPKYQGAGQAAQALRW